MASEISALILTGYGLNCEAESKTAWTRAGARVRLLHLKDLLARPDTLHEHDILMFIGGFSFGDHLGSGHVFAARLRHRLRDPLQRFIDDGKLILGVCNGFQIMVKLGLLPGLDRDYFTPRLALLPNDCGAFQNFWVTLRFEPDSPCVFTRGLTTMELPIRHGEGKLHVPDPDLRQRLQTSGGVAARYADPSTGEAARRFPHNPNGSMDAIAALCDPSGRICGLMPHPEAFLDATQHPRWDLHRARETQVDGGAGQQIFNNAVRYLRERNAGAPVSRSGA